MIDSKFVILFKTLKPTEEKAFYKHLKLIHGDKEAFHLYEYLRKFHPRFEEDKKLSMEYAFQAVRKESIAANENNRNNMLNDLYELHKWLKAYLLAQRAGPDTWEGQALWLDILLNRGLKKEFAKEAAHFYDETEKAPKGDTADYFKAVVANYYQYLLLTEDKLALKAALQAPIDAIEVCSETVRLQLACEVLNRAQIHPFFDNQKSKGAKKKSPNPAPTTDQRLLVLYREVHYLLSIQPGQLADEQYNKLETLLLSSTKSIAPAEWLAIFKYLSNYAAKQIRMDRADIYAEKIHNLNQLGIKYDIFKQNGHISASQFNNIVTVACTAGKMSWALNFIEQQKRFLEPSEKDEVIAIAKAIIDFENKEYPKVKAALLPLDPKNLHERIRLRSLVLRAYYELDEDYGIVQNYYLAFEQLLRRQEAPRASYVDAAFSFISVFKVLMARNTSKPTLLKRIKDEPNLFSRSWLYEKALVYQQIKSKGRKRE